MKSVNLALPTYSQFAVRRLITSNNHQTGAEIANNNTNSLRERVQREVPVRLSTNPSTTRIYPSQSGKNRYAVRIPGKNQFSGQKMATRSSPHHHCGTGQAGHLAAVFISTQDGI